MLFVVPSRQKHLPWIIFFLGSAIVLVVDSRQLVFFALCGTLVIVWAESKFPRNPQLASEPVASKLAYIFAKRATRPITTAIVVAVGLDLWRPSWGLVANGWPVWAQALVFLVSVDFTKYWVHRAQHRIPLWWKFHRVHHLYRDLRSVSHGPTHLGEFAILQAAVVYGLALALGVEGRAVIYGCTIPFLLVSGSWGHANLDIPRGRMPNWAFLVMSPNFHCLHHNREIVDRNFGEVFSCWDYLFGTALCPIENRRLLHTLGVANELPTGNIWRDQFLQVRRESARF